MDWKKLLLRIGVIFSFGLLGPLTALSLFRVYVAVGGWQGDGWDGIALALGYLFFGVLIGLVAGTVLAFKQETSRLPRLILFALMGAVLALGLTYLLNVLID